MKDSRELPEWTVWAKPLAADGSKVAALAINTRQDEPAALSVSLAALGLVHSEAKGTDVWSGVTTSTSGPEWKVSLPSGGHQWMIFEAE
jgi:hypothetical protein